MSPRILSAEKLRAQMATITEHLPPSMDLPSRDITTLYQLMSAKCDVVTDYIIFVVKVPLVLRTEFELYKLLPLPTQINDSYVSIAPSTVYLMVDLQREVFYAPPDNRIDSCPVVDNRVHVCPQLQPLHTKDSPTLKCEAEMINSHKIADSCAITISSPRKIWIQLSTDNHWLFALDTKGRYNVVCGDYTFQQVLEGAGILVFKKTCTMKDAANVISSHNSVKTQLNATFSPAFNLSTEIAVPGTWEIPQKATAITSYVAHVEEITDLQKKLTTLRQQEEQTQRLQPHDIHQYSIGYAALTATVIIAIVMGCLYRKQKNSAGLTVNQITTERKVAIGEGNGTPRPAPRRSKFTAADFNLEVIDFKRGQDVKA